MVKFRFTIWDFFCSPISEKIYVLNLSFLAAPCAACDYAESYGWFLSRENADASHTVYLKADAS